VVVIDEMADLVLVSRTRFERAVARIIEQGNSVGIHLVCATNRVSADVLSGALRARFSAVLARRVRDARQSHTLPGMKGAERLLGPGDALFLPPGQMQPIRLATPLVTERDIEAAVTAMRHSL